jgi:peptidoglycan/LPS O-acetylase OafA/YrhL
MVAQKSLFLDFIRISAALIVLYGHAVLIFFGDINDNPFLVSNMRHFAVVLFFVLSGYVIGFTTKINNRGAKQYAVARLSRLSSMVIPALVVSFVIECTLNFLTSNRFQIDFISILRYLISASFMNEFWLFSSAPRINGALWSVSFEFYFYLIFGVYFFTNTRFKKVTYTTLACLFAGPKILVMFPIWIVGYCAFIYNEKLFKYKSYFLFCSFFFITFLCYLYLPPYPYLLGYKPFYFANQFLTDFITGILFGFSIILLPDYKSLNISDRFIKQFRKIADYTFPIYVLHYPILKLSKVVLQDKFNLDNQFYLAVALSLIISVLIGGFLEKFRYKWSEFFENILEMTVINFTIKKVQQ